MNDSHRGDGDAGREDLDLYVDGLLDDERRAAFERRLFADPELAAELERQRALEARLTAAFPVPEDPAALTRDALGGGRRPAPDASWRTLVPVAAAGALVLGLGLWAAGLVGGGRDAPGGGAAVVEPVAMEGGPGAAAPGEGAGPPGPAGPAAGIRRVVPGGVLLEEGGQACLTDGDLFAELTEDWRRAVGACGLPHDLPRHFEETLGQALLVDGADAPELEGPFTTRRWPTTTLLVSPREPGPVLVLVDALARDPRPVLEPDSPASLFRRELGDLVLYELSPRDTSCALGWFRLD